jgi:ribosomal protein S18 acetylase RimI-like enzyme
MNNPQICIANPKQYPDAVASLTEAFLEDPVLSYLFEDEEYRPLLLSAFFANRLASRTETDLLLLPSGYEKSAAALWEKPDKDSENDSSFSGAIAAAVTVLGEQWLSDRLVNLGPLFEAKPETKHWYLSFIGTRPEARGKGLASTLITEITETCDKDKIPAYLESSNPENVALYEKHGFEVTGEVTLKNGPIVPLMWREPSFE